MRDSKLELRAFGLAFAAALGLMAFMTASARAETLTDGGKAASFLVNKITSLAKPGVTFELVQIGKGALSVKGRNLSILCEVSILAGEFKSSTEALGSAKLTKCAAFEFAEEGKTHTKILPCTVAEPISVEKVVLLPRKHEGVPYIYIEEDPVGAGLATVKISGAECTLPKENKLTGSWSVQLDNNDTIEPIQLSSEAIQKLMGGKLLFGTFEAQLKSESKLKLTDAAHKGMTLGVC